jgi:hypothetical protein
MSIYDAIARKVKDRELFPVSSTLGFPKERRMWLTPDVNVFVFGPHADPKVSRRRLRLELELTWFVDGGQVNVAVPDAADPYADRPDADFRLLYPWEDEIWEIRSKLQPQIRIFGRFAGPDDFIGILRAFRKDLGEPPPAWAQCGTCKSEWERIFPLHSPHNGKRLHDYIRKNAIPV